MVGLRALMKTRLLQVSLAEALKAKQGDLSSTKFAKEIGISTKKLEALKKDEWKYIHRDSIERVADFLGLDAEQIFAFQEIDFWKSIREQRQCTFIRGSKRGRNITIRQADQNAITVMTEFFGEMVPNFEYGNHPEGGDENELILQSQTENCIVIGSPKSNAATEVLISRIFGVEPFSSSDDERKSIPFGFCWEADSSLDERSTLTCSGRARKQTSDLSGIGVKDGPHVEVDHMDADEFRKRSIKKGKDAGLIFVVNKPFGTEHPVKLIILAGFSGLGTIGAAKALLKDYRYLEPYPNEPYVYGVVECWYSKPEDSTSRTLTDFRWRYRHGGYKPIGNKVKTKKVSRKK